MIQFLLMLLGLAFGNHNGNMSTNNTNNFGIQSANGLHPETGTGGDDGNGGTGGPIGGNTGQTPPTP